VKNPDDFNLIKLSVPLCPHTRSGIVKWGNFSSRMPDVVEVQGIIPKRSLICSSGVSTEFQLAFIGITFTESERTAILELDGRSKRLLCSK
jgi:hypothetical protein